VSTQNTTLEETAAARWRRRITKFFTISDQWDFDSFGEYLDPQIQFRFANNPTVDGLETMIGFAAAHKSSIKSVEHTLLSFHTDVEQRTVAVELRVRYIRPDDTIAQYPAIVVLEFGDDDLIKGYRVYVDLTGLV
jgi:ketosteroid isomerase-like protein